jgi:hypothetical protein
MAHGGLGKEVFFFFFFFFFGFLGGGGRAGGYARATRVRCTWRARVSRDGRGIRLGWARGGDGRGSFLVPWPPPFDRGGTTRLPASPYVGQRTNTLNRGPRSAPVDQGGTTSSPTHLRWPPAICQHVQAHWGSRCLPTSSAYFIKLNLHLYIQ